MIKGFANIVLIITVVVLAGSAIAVNDYQRRVGESIDIISTPSPSPSPTPQSNLI